MMTKTVTLEGRLYNWILRHSFVTEGYIISIVQFTPVKERTYLNHYRFELTVRRRKNHGFVWIEISVTETSDTLVVDKLHSYRA